MQSKEFLIKKDDEKPYKRKKCLHRKCGLWFNPRTANQKYCCKEHQITEYELKTAEKLIKKNGG